MGKILTALVSVLTLSNIFKREVGHVVPVADSPNKYLIGVGQEHKLLEWDGVSSTPSRLTSVEFLNEHPSITINDGKCDSKGRLILGSLDMEMAGACTYSEVTVI